MAVQSSPFQSRIDPGMAAAMERTAKAEPGPRAVQKDPVVIVQMSPAELAAMMAEEAGFMNAEREGGTEESQNDEDFGDFVDELIRKSLQAQKTAPVTPEEAKDLRDRLVQGGTQARSGQQLEETLRRFSGGSSQKALALMAALAELAKTDPELQRLGFGQKAVVDYASVHETGLTAALNIAEVLASSPDATPSVAQRLLGMYEDSIAGSQSVLQTLQRLGRAEGMPAVMDSSKFLTQAVAADLAQQSSGGDKVHLQQVLTELKGMRVKNTLTQGLDKLAKVMPKGQAPNTAAMMQTTLDYIEQPLREMPGLDTISRNLPLERQILFFQGFRNFLKSIPDDAFASPEQKSGTLVPLQKRVDDLTWTEEV